MNYIYFTYFQNLCSTEVTGKLMELEECLGSVSGVLKQGIKESTVSTALY